MWFIKCALWESSMLQGTYLVFSGNVCSRQYRKVLLCLDENVLPYSMLHVCSQIGVRFLVDSNSWNVKPQNCEADAQSTEPAGFWQCSCTALRIFFSWVNKNQISSTKFSIFKSVAIW